MRNLVLIVAFVICGASTAVAQDVIRVEHDGSARLAHIARKTSPETSRKGEMFSLSVQTPQRNLQVTVTCRAAADICIRLFDAFALAYGYQDAVPNPNFDPGKPVDESNPQTILNPETKQEFMWRKVEEYIREAASTKEADLAAQAAREAKKAELDSQLKGTQVRP